MAAIKPLSVWRYNRKIEAFTSPLFDVVPDKYRNKRYREKYNSIHLAPQGEKPGLNAEKTLRGRGKNGIVKQDELLATSVCYQYFTPIGSSKAYCKKGFIAKTKVYQWEDEVVLRHEHTMHFSVSDRMSLLDKTPLNISPTHGLYTDESKEIDNYPDEAIKNPIYDT